MFYHARQVVLRQGENLICILGKNKLVELTENYKCIYPFDYNLLDGDSYILTVKE